MNAVIRQLRDKKLHKEVKFKRLANNKPDTQFLEAQHHGEYVIILEDNSASPPKIWFSREGQDLVVSLDQQADVVIVGYYDKQEQSFYGKSNDGMYHRYDIIANQDHSSEIFGMKMESGWGAWYDLEDQAAAFWMNDSGIFSLNGLLAGGAIMTAGILSALKHGNGVESTPKLTADINQKDGASLTGATEPNSTVTAFLPNNQTVTTVSDAFGHYEFVLSPALIQGENVTVQAVSINGPLLTQIPKAPDFNVAPIAQNDTVQVDENGTVTLDVLSNDSDADHDKLTISNAYVKDGLGKVEIVAGQLKFTTQDMDRLAVGDTETATIEYTTIDPSGLVSTTTALVTIVGSNDAPTVSAALFKSYPEDSGKVSINLLQFANDVDRGATLHMVYPSSTVLPTGFSAQGNLLLVDPSNAVFQSLNVGETRDHEIVNQILDEHGASVNQRIIVTITGTNDLPIVTNIQQAVAEDSGIAIFDLMGSVTDVDHHSKFTIELDASALPKGLSVAGKQLMVNPDLPEFQSLNVGETKTLTVQYKVIDDNGASVLQSATIVITGTNDAPTVSAAIYHTVAEDAKTVTYDLLEFASDIDHAAVLSAVFASDFVVPEGLTISGNGVTVNPGANVFQSLKVGETRVMVLPYLVKDENGGATQQTATITITGSNDTPAVTSSIQKTYAEDSANTSIDLLEFASDIDHQAQLNAVFADGYIAPEGLLVVGNQLMVNPSATVFQRLNVGESTVMTLPYQVKDELGATVNQTVTVTITGTNDTPTVSSAIEHTVIEDTKSMTYDLLEFASDIDHAAVLHAQFPAGYVVPEGFTLSGNEITVDPTASVFQPLKAGQSKSFTFQYDVVDEHGAKTPQTTVINVLGIDEPIIVSPKSYTVAEDTTDQSIDLLAGVENAAGRSLKVVFGSDFVMPEGYSLVGNTLKVDASLTKYQALQSANLFGDQVFNYKIIDLEGSETATQTIKVNVTGVNDAPIWSTNKPSILGAKNTYIPLHNTGLSIADVDVASDKMTLTLTSTDPAAKLRATVGNSGVEIVSGSGSNTDTNTLTLSGTLTQINALLNSVGGATGSIAVNYSSTVAPTTGTPSPTAVPIQMTIVDNDRIQPLSANKTIEVLIVDVNIAPTAADSKVTIDEDTSYTFNAARFGFSDANDSAIDQFLNVMITTLPLAGTLTLAGIAVKAGQVIPVAQLSTLTFTPVADANGTNYASFNFKVQDNGGTQYGGADWSSASNTITIDVTPVSDAPINTIANTSTPEDVARSLGGISVGGQTDDSLISVKLEVTSGKLSASSSATVQVTGTETGALTLTGKTADVNAFLASTTSQPTFTPVANTNGTVNLTMTTVDKVTSATDVDQAVITVTPVNDAPGTYFNNTKITADHLPTFTAIDAGQVMDLSNLSIRDIDDDTSIAQALTPATHGLNGGSGATNTAASVFTILKSDGVTLDDGALKIKGLTGEVAGTTTKYTLGTATALFDSTTATLTITGDKLTDINAVIAKLQYVDSDRSVGDVKLKYVTTDRSGLIDPDATVIILPINDYQFLTNNSDGTLDKPIQSQAGQDIMFGKAGADVLDAGSENDIVFGGFGTGVRNYQFDYWNLPYSGTGKAVNMTSGAGFVYQHFLPNANTDIIGWESTSKIEFISTTVPGRSSDFGANGFFSLDQSANNNDTLGISQNVMTASGEAYRAKLTVGASGVSAAPLILQWNGQDIVTIQDASTGKYTTASGYTVTKAFAGTGTGGSYNYYTYTIDGLVGTKDSILSKVGLKSVATADNNFDVTTELTIDAVLEDAGDTLAGGLGADFIWGQAGNDVIYAGKLGSTAAASDSAADTIVIDMRLNEGNDVVKDFVVGEDRLFVVDFIDLNTTKSLYPNETGLDNKGTNVDATLRSDNNLNNLDFTGRQALVLSDSAGSLKLSFANGTSVVLEGVAYEATAVAGNKAYGSVEELLGTNATQILYITGDSIPEGMGSIL